VVEDTDQEGDVERPVVVRLADSADEVAVGGSRTADAGIARGRAVSRPAAGLRVLDVGCLRSTKKSRSALAKTIDRWTAS
jgi:hypothetical protein